MNPPSVAEVDEALTAPGSRFEIDEVVIRGVSTRVWKSAPATLVDVLRASRSHAERIFTVYEDEQVSFEEHFASAARLAHVLRGRFGIRNGDRVAIAMRNYPEWSIAFWAAAAAGAVIVPLNAWWTAEELEYGLADSGSRVVFVDEERAGRIGSFAAKLPGIEALVAVRAAAAAPPGALDWDDVLGRPGHDFDPDIDVPDVTIATDDATIFYTSGTTGHPKGALGTHRNICTNAVNLSFILARASARAGGARAGGENREPRSHGQNAYLLSVPLFHATGCHSILVANTLSGGKLVMMHRWDPRRALELIERESITHFGGVPTMVMQVLDHPDFDHRDTSSVRSVSYGGAPAPPELALRIKEHFNSSPASNGYGLTETSALSTMNAGVDYLSKPDSVGAPPPVVSVKVVDESGQELPSGAVGELWIKGPNVVKGYWNKPEATAESFTAGWLHSGDVARIDPEGFVYIVDRAKDMIIRGGENVYCVEVEAVIHGHPAVADVAVIGIPHPALGEEVGAVVQLHRGSIASQKDIQDLVGEHLAAFKVPTKVWFYPTDLPRNPAGKVLKRELRAELAG